MSALWQQFIFALEILLIAYLTTYVAARNGFFRFPSPSARYVPPGYLFRVIAAFVIYLVSQIVLFPALLVAVLGADRAKELFHHDAYYGGLLTILGVLFAASMVFLFVFCCKAEIKHAVWGNLRRPLHDWFVGVATWLVGYPLALAVGQLVALLVAIAFSPPEIDQVAVKELKRTLQYPELATGMIGVVVLVVPVVEEILFRGFLQTYLTQYFNRYACIACASAIFALFHFSSSQGFSNFELLSSLFVLACFLGFIYERQQSLWAPIGLHMTFNSVSAVMILSS